MQINNQAKEKLKGEKALAIAKSIPRKVVFVPRGITGEVFGSEFNLTNCRSKTRKLDHSEVLECIKQGMSHKDMVQKFKVSSQAISYIKNKFK